MSKKILTMGAAVIAVAFVGGWLWADRAQSVPAVAGTAEVVMYQNPACGCCGNWVAHMREAGFEVEVHKTGEINNIKRREGITAEIASCHTAFVDGYIIEGHVPARDIQRLLAERPDVKGLTVPGMPIGSPGMEQGGRVQSYDVPAFDTDGNTTVFASY